MSEFVFTAEMEGLKAAKYFEKMGRAVEDELDETLLRAGKLVEGEAKSNVRKLTGRTELSIATRLGSGKEVLTGTRWFVGRFLENGTKAISPNRVIGRGKNKGQEGDTYRHGKRKGLKRKGYSAKPAQPFLKPAAADKWDEIKALFAQVVKKDCQFGGD